MPAEISSFSRTSATPGGTVRNRLESSCRCRMSPGEEGEENELSSRGLRLSSVRVYASRTAAHLGRETVFLNDFPAFWTTGRLQGVASAATVRLRVCSLCLE